MQRSADIVRGLLILSTLPACSGKDTLDSAVSNYQPPEITILSPADGASAFYGDEVSLEAQVNDSTTGELLDAALVQWSADGWSYEGAQGTVSDLPVGELELQASATVDEGSASDTVFVSILPEVVPYAGTLMADVVVSSGKTSLDYSCEGEATITIERRSSLFGNGTCLVKEIHGEFPFEIEGTQDGALIAGDMLITYGKAEYAVPFSGTEDADGSLSAIFEGEQEFGSWLLTVSGSFEVSP